MGIKKMSTIYLHFFLKVCYQSFSERIGMESGICCNLKKPSLCAPFFNIEWDVSGKDPVSLDVSGFFKKDAIFETVRRQ